MNDLEVRESSEQFVQAWAHLARKARGGEVIELPGLVATWVNVAFPILNNAFVRPGVHAADDLRACARTALAHATPRGLPWMLTLCVEELPEALRAEAKDILAAEGLTFGMSTTGMVADALLPPKRPLPDFAYRSFVDQEAALDAARINAESYHAPVEPLAAAVELGALGGPGDFGFTVDIDGKAASCATTVPVDGRLYVAWVATRPEFRRRGCAEAAMRRSLEAAAAHTGLRRTVLHATADGYPVYIRMGYRPAATFHSYMPAG
jgi:ribosomal protein S18 acetylase RimI-like enzyme